MLAFFEEIHLAFAVLLCLATVSHCQYPNVTTSVIHAISRPHNISASATLNSTSLTTTTSYNASGYGAMYNNPFDTSMSPYAIVPPNPSLANFCSSSWVSDRNKWDKTVATGGITQVDTTVVGNQYGSIWTITESEGWQFPVIGGTGTNSNNAASFSPTISSPCCLNCTFFGGNVQVYYWPTPAPTANISTLVNDAGFTFVSPSVYVAFQQLNATNLCGQVGGVYGSTTLGFAPNELSTSIAKKYPISDEGNFLELIGTDLYTSTWTAFTYADLQENCTYITSSVGAFDGWGSLLFPPGAASTEDGGPGMSFVKRSAAFSKPYVTYSYNPCSPTLSVPSVLFSIDPAWKTCIAGIKAFYDPPRLLEPANMLTPPAITPAVKHMPTTTPAQAVPPIAPPTPEPTDPPLVVDPSSNKHPADPEVDASQPAPPDPLQWLQGADPGALDGSGTPTKAKPSKVAADPSSNEKPEDPQQPKNPNNPAQDPQNAHPHQPQGSNPSEANTQNDGDSIQAQEPAHEAPATPDAPIESSNLSPNVHDPAINVVDPTATHDPVVDPPSPVGDTAHTVDSAVALVHAIPNTVPLATVGGRIASVDPDGNVRFGSHVVISNAPATNIDNTPVSLGAGGVILGGSTTIPVNPSYYVAGSQTLTPGGSAVIVSGTSYSLPAHATAVVVEGTTQALPKPSNAAPVLAIGTAHIAPDKHSVYNIAGQTLSAGGPAITLSGTTYSLPSQPTALIVNGKTSQIPGAQVTSPPLPPLNIGDIPVSANADSEYIVAGQTLAPGGSPIVISSTTYSLPTQPTALIINGKTSSISNPYITAGPLPPFHIGPTLISPNAQSEYIISGQTLSPGGSAITVSSTVYSLPSSPTVIVINNTPFPFSLPPLTVGSLPVTANSNGDYMTSSQTLHAGGSPITISDTTLSLASDDAFLVINGVTSTLDGASWRSAGAASLPAAETGGLGLGAVIAGALGHTDAPGPTTAASNGVSGAAGSGTANGTGAPAVFTADAGRTQLASSGLIGGLSIGAVFWII